VSINSPLKANALGIETVYQEQALVGVMSVARNFHMGREPVKWAGFLDKQKMKECMIPLGTLGLSIKSPDLLVENLSGGEKQGTAIARAMYFKAKLVVLDEPTRALAAKGVQTVLDLVKGLKEANIAVVYITHTLHHVYSVADRFVIMAKGKIVKNINRGEASLEELTEMLMA
jgi:simple sugar transport system ATP-binding protein